MFPFEFDQNYSFFQIHLYGSIKTIGSTDDSKLKIIFNQMVKFFG